jgi:iron(III) transport system ATP-binding protein
VAVLRDGAIVQQGTPAELYDAPVDADLASFLGDANFLEARFERSWAHTALGRLALRPDPMRPPGLTHGTVIVRPEQLRVVPAQNETSVGSPREREDPSSNPLAGGGPSAGGLRGTVEQCRYYGHDALLHIRLEGQHGGPPEGRHEGPPRPGHVRRALIARVRGELALPVGAPVRVGARGQVGAVGYGESPSAAATAGSASEPASRSLPGSAAPAK